MCNLRGYCREGTEIIQSNSASLSCGCWRKYVFIQWKLSLLGALSCKNRQLLFVLEKKYKKGAKVERCPTKREGYVKSTLTGNSCYRY